MFRPSFQRSFLMRISMPPLAGNWLVHASDSTSDNPGGRLGEDASRLGSNRRRSAGSTGFHCAASSRTSKYLPSDSRPNGFPARIAIRNLGFTNPVRWLDQLPHVRQRHERIAEPRLGDRPALFVADNPANGALDKLLGASGFAARISGRFFAGNPGSGCEAIAPAGCGCMSVQATTPPAAAATRQMRVIAVLILAMSIVISICLASPTAAARAAAPRPLPWLNWSASLIVASAQADAADGEEASGEIGAASSNPTARSAPRFSNRAFNCAAAGRAALQRSQRQPKLRRGLLLGQALEVKQNEWGAELLGQPLELVVEHVPLVGLALDIASRVGWARPIAGNLDGLALMSPAPSRRPAHFGRDPQRNTVQPARDRLAPPDRAGLAGQDQEYGLGGILGVVLVTQNLTACPHDHCPVALDEYGKSGLGQLIPPQDEAREQLAVGRSDRCPGSEQCVDLLQDDC